MSLAAIVTEQAGSIKDSFIYSITFLVCSRNDPFIYSIISSEAIHKSRNLILFNATGK